MLTLYKYTPAWGLPDLSPFVLKLETYLRMAKIPYRTALGDPRKAPKGKLPYIEHDGALVGDSSLAIERLKKDLGDPLDARLDDHRRAIGTAFKSALEEHLYFVIVYERWKIDENWERYAPVMRDLLAQAKVPFPLRGLVLRQARRNVLKSLHGQGTGRHARDEVSRIGNALVTSVADSLGDSPFLLGPEPTSFDATAYAFLASLMDPPFDSSVRDTANARPSLRAYVDRMKSAYW
jgi:glutathione S-transferase